MTRADHIGILRRQYREAILAHKRKKANEIYARMQSLVTRQIRAENRQDKKVGA